MWAGGVVGDEPGVERHLHLLDGLEPGAATLDAEVLVEHGAVEALDYAVRLRPLHPGGAPRGPGATYRSSPWSREWIFRHLDPRFQPILGAPREPFAKMAESRPNWPKPGSVFIVDSTVVVQ